MYGDAKTAQAIVDRYKGTGIIKRGGKNSVKELVQADSIIGKYW